MSETDAEAKKAVYDRQIRLWGAEAQERIGASRALLWGFGGLNVEVCKNIILAGISVTVCDERPVGAAQLGANFFLREDDVGKGTARACLPRIAELNPFASAEVVDGVDEEKLDGYAVVVVERTAQPEAKYYEKVLRVAKAAREKKIAFFYARGDADKGLVQADLGSDYGYVTDKKVPKVAQYPAFAFFGEESSWNFARRKQDAPVAAWLEWIDKAYASSFSSKGEDYVAFAKAQLSSRGLDVPQEALERHRSLAGAQLGFAAAVLGGVLAQEVIKVIAGGVGAPLEHLFIFDTTTDTCTVYALPVAGQSSDGEPAAKKRKVIEEEALDVVDIDGDGPIEVL